MDTYFQAEQSCAIAILYAHPEAKKQFGTELLTQFLKDADEAAFQFLRSYFGFTE